MERKFRIHPLNTEGKYYVDQESCLIHGVCGLDSPNNFKLIENYKSENFGAYVFKQPENQQEETDCQSAMNHCPMRAIHDDGK